MTAVMAMALLAITSLMWLQLVMMMLQRSQGEATVMVYFRKQVPSGLRILTKNVHVTVFKYLYMYVVDSEKTTQDFEDFIFRW